MDEALLYNNSSFSHAKDLGANQIHSNLDTGSTTENVAFFPKIIPASVKSIVVPMSVNQRNWREDDEIKEKWSWMKLLELYHQLRLQLPSRKIKIGYLANIVIDHLSPCVLYTLCTFSPYFEVM